MKTIALFNNKGGVGKTTLSYHLAAMFAELGQTALMVDLDPQANLTAMVLDEDSLEALWEPPSERATVYGSLEPIVEGTGDLRPPDPLTRGMGRSPLVAGDLALASFEEELSAAWPDCLGGRGAPFRKVAAFSRLVRAAADKTEADIAILDVGPNLGAINRSALLAADAIVVPVAADLFSLQGLRNLGPTLAAWKKEWSQRLGEAPDGLGFELPAGNFGVLGYVVMQHAIRLDRPVKSYAKWHDRIAPAYREYVGNSSLSRADDDPCLASLKNYRSLIPLSQEARKPMFRLTAADGAVGGHDRAVRGCREDFRALAMRIAAGIGVPPVDRTSASTV